MRPIPIHARNPGPFTGDGNWTWLVRGQVPTLVDAGTGTATHLDELRRVLGGQPLNQVLVTHGHRDHVEGVAALREMAPGARFAKWPWPERDRTWPVAWQPLAGGQIVAAGDEALQVVHTPGHAPDHVCFWHDPTRTLFAGDLMIAGATVWIPASAGGDLTAYLASLARVLALAPARVLPAHGPIIEDPAALITAYLARRQAREAQVLDALRHGEVTPAGVAARVYAALPDRLSRMARENVLAHLVKLEGDGRARRSGDDWHII